MHINVFKGGQDGVMIDDRMETARLLYTRQKMQEVQNLFKMSHLGKNTGFIVF